MQFDFSYKTNPRMKWAERFMLTLNNPTEEERRKIQTTKQPVKDIAAELEEARTTGTPHLQGYFEVHDTRRMRPCGRDATIENEDQVFHTSNKSSVSEHPR
jgi:DNA polymerase/3'-5' exonuclease PolX